MSASSRVSRSSACSPSPTRPPILYITTRPSRGQKSFFCTLLSLSCQTSSPPRLTRAPLRPSAPSQRMSSERQTQVIQVSFCNIVNRDTGVYYIPVPSRRSDGHGPCHPCSLHPVSLSSLCSDPSFHRTVWTDFSMLIQRAQSGSIAIVSCFLMGTFSFALAAPSEIVRMSHEFASSHA